MCIKGIGYILPSSLTSRFLNHFMNYQCYHHYETLLVTEIALSKVVSLGYHLLFLRLYFSSDTPKEDLEFCLLKKGIFQLFFLNCSYSRGRYQRSKLFGKCQLLIK